MPSPTRSTRESLAGLVARFTERPVFRPLAVMVTVSVPFVALCVRRVRAHVLLPVFRRRLAGVPLLSFELSGVTEGLLAADVRLAVAVAGLAAVRQTLVELPGLSLLASMPGPSLVLLVGVLLGLLAGLLPGLLTGLLPTLLGALLASLRLLLALSTRLLLAVLSLLGLLMTVLSLLAVLLAVLVRRLLPSLLCRLLAPPLPLVIRVLQVTALVRVRGLSTLLLLPVLGLLAPGGLALALP